MKPYLWYTNNTRCNEWFERDRAMVRLTDMRDNEIMVMFDDDVSQFIEDGFKSNRETWHQALSNYATDLKLTARYDND
jgi:hypothetical protein